MQFFKQLFDVLADKQDVKIDLKKVGEDLVGMITIAGRSYQMTGKPEDFDNSFMEEIQKPAPKEAEESGLKSTALPAAKKSESSTGSSASKKSSAKKSASKSKKKAPAKKADKPVKEKGKPGRKPGSKNKPKPNPDQLDIITVPQVTETATSEEDKKKLEELQEKQLQERFDLLMTSGRAHMADGEFKEATDVFQTAMDEYPGSDIAKTEFEAANKKRTEKIIADAITESTAATEAKDFQKAFDIVNDLLQIFPDDQQLAEAKEKAHRKLEAFKTLNS